MNEEVENENLINELPAENRPDSGLLGIAKKLFEASFMKEGKIETEPRDVVFVYLKREVGDGKTSDTMIMILDDKLSLWFNNKVGAWKYDGWEAGDYKKSWEEYRIK